MHPSLRAYIDCFDSAPFPRAWPRGGGIWDQDPILVRDFRVIRDYEIKWKQSQEQRAEIEGEYDEEGGGHDLESMLDAMGLEDDQFF